MSVAVVANLYRFKKQQQLWFYPLRVISSHELFMLKATEKYYTLTSRLISNRLFSVFFPPKPCWYQEPNWKLFRTIKKSFRMENEPNEIRIEINNHDSMLCLNAGISASKVEFTNVRLLKFPKRITDVKCVLPTNKCSSYLKLHFIYDVKSVPYVSKWNPTVTENIQNAKKKPFFPNASWFT